MKKALLLLFLTWCEAAFAAAAPKKPKLIVTLVVDQFRYDYLTRFRSNYTAGFLRLLRARRRIYRRAPYRSPYRDGHRTLHRPEWRASGAQWNRR